MCRSLVNSLKNASVGESTNRHGVFRGDRKCEGHGLGKMQDKGWRGRSDFDLCEV